MATFVEKLNHWFEQYGEAAQLYVEVKRLRELRPAMRALLSEFRQRDLPYGSPAYSRGVTALNAADRDMAESPLPDLTKAVVEFRALVLSTPSAARESQAMDYVARKRFTLATALSAMFPLTLEVAPSLKYLLDLSNRALPEAESISDVRLATRMGHTRTHSQTELLRATVDGQSYTLLLSGYIEGHDPLTGDFDTATISACQLEQLELPWEQRAEWGQVLEMEHGPWFEWVDVEGNPVGDVFGSVSLDPEQELVRLTQMLKPALMPVSFVEPSVIQVP